MKTEQNKKINILKAKVNEGALTKKDEGIIKAPDLIIKALNEIYSSFNEKEIKFQIYEYHQTNNIKEDLENIEKKIIEKKIKGIIGGDHSISYSTIKAFKKRYKKGKIIIFDAHPDTESDFYISHEDYLRVLIKENIIKPHEILIIGVRNGSIEEYDFLKKKGIKYFKNIDVFENIEKIKEELQKYSEIPCFISIDIDVIDPGFAPGTGYIEPFGLLPWQIHSLYKTINNIKMFDICEINSTKDQNNLTINLSARICYELSEQIAKD